LHKEELSLAVPKSLKVLIAVDSFKGSVSSTEVCDFLAEGILNFDPTAIVYKKPLADGGEGTVEALVSATGGRFLEEEVCGPLGEKVRAVYGILGDGQTAVIEMAAASGLPLVPPKKRNPRLTTTKGTGELILKALEQGVKKIIVGIGGSATNDGGAGMLQALGMSLKDKDGYEIGPGGEALLKLQAIDTANLDPRLKEVAIQVACDVNNPLCGEKGASYVYGPQKGATEEDVKLLDEALAHYAEVVKKELGKDIKDIPGAGAAGGLGAGFLVLGAELTPGAPLIIEASGVRKLLGEVDLVITGEGKIDEQTVYGKLPIVVAELAAEKGVPVVAVTGYFEEKGRVILEHGIDAVYSLPDRPMSLEEAFQRTPQLLREAGEEIYRFLTLLVK